MKFITHVLEDAVALVLAFAVVVALLATFGSSPAQRYDCEMKTTNPIADVTCILKTAL